jgi:hypothetical protein
MPHCCYWDTGLFPWVPVGRVRASRYSFFAALHNRGRRRRVGRQLGKGGLGEASVCIREPSGCLGRRGPGENVLCGVHRLPVGLAWVMTVFRHRNGSIAFVPKQLWSRFSSGVSFWMDSDPILGGLPSSIYHLLKDIQLSPAIHLGHTRGTQDRKQKIASTIDYRSKKRVSIP